MPRLHTACLIGSVFLALAACSEPVTAVTGDAHQAYDINLLEVAPPSQKVAPGLLRQLQASGDWLAWQANHPGWQAQWNLRSKTVHRAWGPGVRLSNLPPTPESIESDCRNLLQQTSAWSGIDTSQLRLLQARFKLNRWYVTFEQVIANTPVFGGRIDLRVAADGQLMMLGAEGIAAGVPDGDFSLDTPSALQAAQFDFARPAQSVESQRRILVSVPSAARSELRWAEEIFFRTEEPLGRWHCLVDAESGRILQRNNLLRFAEVTGNIAAWAEPSTPGDTQQLFPLPDTRLNIGGGLTQFGFTDALGDFRITVNSVDSVNVFLRMAGLYARVYNDALGRTTPRIDSKILPGSPQDFVWDDSNSRASERDAYTHTLKAHDFIKQLDPSFTGVDYIMPVVVDIGGRECNAWWDGTGINFLAAGNRCVNIARIADVVYHEYGHGITEWQYQPLSPSGAMHEGFSDYLAASMRNDPVIGNGFFGPGTSLRSIDNQLRIPEDLSGEVHDDGLILAGALWDLRTVLGAARTDTLFHFARYGMANNFDDYLLDILVTDDDNGNIYDGTPNFDAIINAFEAHGIGDFSVQISHQPLSDTENVTKPLTIESTILSLFPLEAASLTLHYRINAGLWVALPLQATGGMRTFAATLPAQTSGTTIDYWLEAADTQGNTSFSPATAPDDLYQFTVGPDMTPPQVLAQQLADRPLDAPGWTVQADVRDNLDRGIGGIDLLWSRGNADLGQTLPMSALTNTTWSAAIPTTGANLGDVVHYALVASDSASTPNTTRVPATGTWSFRVVQGFLRDFEENAGGLTGSGDWQWGAPSVGPPAAWSGDKLWATGLDTGYQNDQHSNLELPPTDLGTWKNAALTFHHWLSAEEFFDGGRTEASLDNGTTWQLLVPDGGYPWEFIEQFGGPGFSGTSDGWESVSFDLSRYLGRVVRVRLQFASDGGLTDLGWYIDNLEMTEQQILAVPLQLTSRSGGDAMVPLRWNAPAGIDPLQADTPLLGYNIYRSLQADFTDALLLNQVTLPSAQYIDIAVDNGLQYYYAVTALYAGGESRRSGMAQAQPYRAGYFTAVQELVVETAVGASADTSITFENAGTGFLTLNTWIGDPGQNIDQVRIAWDIPTGAVSKVFAVGGSRQQPTAKSVAQETASEATDADRSGLGIAAADESSETVWARFRQRLPGKARAPGNKPQLQSNAVPEFTVLFEDPQDAAGAVDLKDLAVAYEAGNMFLRITGYSNWGNILTDFTVVINIDSDANRDTGDASGADHYVLIGAFPIDAVGLPAILTNVAQEIVGVPTHVSIPIDGDFLEVGFVASLLGELRRVYLSATALTPDLSSPFDTLPNPAAANSWLALGQSHLSVPVNAPQVLPLTLGAGLPPAAYDANLLLETNDPSQPIVVLPVQFRSGVTPVVLYDFTALQKRNRVHLSWRTTLEQDVLAFRVFRSWDGTAFVPLAPDVTLQTDKQYSFDDLDVAPGLYQYRIGEVATSGDVTLQGLVQIQVTTATPKRAFLDANTPNPFNPSTTLNFGVDRDGAVQLQVFDARGRLVRTLVQVPRMTAGFHSAAWDGRDARGSAVASGIYYARLVVNGRHITRRMTLLK